MIVRVIVPSVFFGSPDDLEIVSMKMERMLSGIVVVQYNLYNLTLLKDEGVSITAVYHGIRSSISGTEDGIQSRNLGCDICDVVEEGTSIVLSIIMARCVEREIDSLICTIP